MVVDSVNMLDGNVYLVSQGDNIKPAGATDFDNVINNISSAIYFLEYLFILTKIKHISSKDSVVQRNSSINRIIPNCNILIGKLNINNVLITIMFSVADI